MRTVQDQLLVAAFGSCRPDRMAWPDRQSLYWLGLRSLFEDLSGDGRSVDLLFGPEPVAGAEGRWIRTEPGHGWFAYFRIHRPGEPAFDGGWRSGDFEVAG